MPKRVGSGAEGKPRKATPEEIADFYEKLRAGTPDEKIGATAKYFRKTPRAIKQSVKFWWPGRKFLREFGETIGRGPRSSNVERSSPATSSISRNRIWPDGEST